MTVCVNGSCVSLIRLLAGRCRWYRPLFATRSQPPKFLVPTPYSSVSDAIDWIRLQAKPLCE